MTALAVRTGAWDVITRTDARDARQVIGDWCARRIAQRHVTSVPKLENASATQTVTSTTAIVNTASAVVALSVKTDIISLEDIATNVHQVVSDAQDPPLVLSANVENMDQNVSTHAGQSVRIVQVPLCVRSVFLEDMVLTAIPTARWRAGIFYAIKYLVNVQ